MRSVATARFCWDGPAEAIDHFRDHRRFSGNGDAVALVDQFRRFRSFGVRDDDGHWNGFPQQRAMLAPEGDGLIGQARPIEFRGPRRGSWIAAEALHCLNGLAGLPIL